MVFQSGSYRLTAITSYREANRPRETWSRSRSYKWQTRIRIQVCLILNTVAPLSYRIKTFLLTLLILSPAPSFLPFLCGRQAVVEEATWKHVPQIIIGKTGQKPRWGWKEKIKLFTPSQTPCLLHPHAARGKPVTTARIRARSEEMRSSRSSCPGWRGQRGFVAQV